MVRPVTGECKLLEAPLDPIADFPVGEVLSFEYAEIASTQAGEIVERVPAEWLLPVHAPALRRPERAGGQVVSDVPTTTSRSAPTATSSSRPTATPAWPARTTASTSTPGTTRPSRSTSPSGRPTARSRSQFNYDYIMGWETDNEEGLKGAFDPVDPGQGARRGRGGRRRALRRRRRRDRQGLAPVRRRPVRRGHRGSRAGLRRRPRPQPVPGRDVLALAPPAGRHRAGPHHPRHRPGRGRDRVGGRPAGHPRAS